MKKKILLGIAALALVIGVAVYASTRPDPPDTRFTGAYALADGTLVFVTPREGKILRYRQMNGESAVKAAACACPATSAVSCVPSSSAERSSVASQ